MSESNSTLQASLDSAETLDDIAGILAGETSEPEETPTPETEDETQELEAEAPEEEEVLAEDSTSDESEIEDDDTWGSALGIDDEKLNLDDDGNFTSVNVKVNGETSKVNMDELITSYQTGKAVTQKSQQLSDDRRQFDADRDAAGKHYQAELTKVTNMAGMLQGQLMAEYNNVDWDALRVTDPAEYAAARQDYSAKAQALQEMGNSITQQTEQANAQQSQQQGEVKRQFIADQANVMLTNNPAWSDAAVMDKDIANLRDGMKQYYNATDEMLQNVTSAMQVAILQDAVKYRQGATVADKKLSKPLPKFQKKSGRRVAKKSTRLDALTKRARTSTGMNKKSAEVDAIAELITNGL